MSDVIIRVAKLPEEFPVVATIRKIVFQEEQGVDTALEFDGKDDICEHLIAYLDNQAVGTARLRYLDDKTVKIERLAVLSIARRQGIGQKIMEEALEFIVHKNMTEVVVYAQLYIKSLYQKLNFIEVGEIFLEAGIPHIEMRMSLS
ncbi:GNAT family N-acetyltransferase [Anabaena sp. FACHB-709]|nr:MULTISPECIES: GNAT family N-acetyltransferase [Nostocaceae]HBW28529.1 GNAT family N-acetyltransferase [Nostoc sp. UBA8866]MBD2172185.1 GNAT family N-acetyltransferase [Anabaena cylindrica FACHB-318]MBD2266957.1 GNAT family N-acetyltransferase [Anabaena sp. FACHB-709]MBD2276008.1 GNAT family N-acetyltransferase [Nostoc sp. PCC 7120 = FACHB-418]MBD2285934.1 GNAT family N-acetyltransferase [Anabaena cylindrica FACHB-170]